MEPRTRLQLSVSGMLLVVACAAVNVWLFRFGMLAGLVGLSVTKHVVIAQLCMVLGVNAQRSSGPLAPPRPTPPAPVQAASGSSA